MMESGTHKPVMLEECLQALAIRPEGIYIDGTFGRGGHSSAILQRLGRGGRLYALDRDPQAVRFAKDALGNDGRFTIIQSAFAMLESVARAWDIVGRVDGLLLDLGVSSPQLDDATRGFSFRADGPLDMRMNPLEGESAAQWLAVVSESELANVIWQFGEERYSKRIARAIVKERQQAPFESTARLAEVVAQAHPAWEKGRHPATRTFQAIRIFINRELDELKVALEASLRVVAPGGRLAVMSFHSLEDRIVKEFIAKHSRGDDFPLDLPVRADQLRPRLRKIGKMIPPSDTEARENPRARSARLRVAEVLA